MRETLRGVVHSLRDDLDFIGGPQALSTPVLLSVVVLGLIGTLANTVFVLGVDVQIASVRFALATGLAIVLLLLARATVLPTSPRRSQPGLVLSVYALISAAVLVVTNIFVEIPTGNIEAPFDFVLLPFFISMILLSSMAFLVGSRARLRELDARLRRRNSELLALQSDYEEIVDDARRTLEAQVEDALGAQLKAIDATISNLDPSSQNSLRDASSQLTMTVRDVVRPLSHGLVDADRAFEDPLVQRADRSLSAPEPQRSLVSLRAALRPGWATVGYIVLTLVAMRIAEADALGSIVRALFCLLAFLLIIVVRAVWPTRWNLNAPLATIVILAPLYFAVLTLSRLAYTTFRSAVDPGLPSAYSATGWVLIMGTMSAALAIAGVTTERRQQTLRSLQDVNSAIEFENARLRQEIWHLRTMLSRYLHGPVQSALTSAAITLNTSDIDANRIQAIRSVISSITEDLRDFDRRPGSLRLAIQEYKNLWAGICDVRADLPPPVEAAIEARPQLVGIVAEICREGITNAIRHGDATTILLEFRLPSPSLLEVVIANDGTLMASDSVAGLGTAFLNEVSLRWERHQEAGMTRLNILLAL